MKFGSEGAVLFRAEECASEVISSPKTLESEIFRRYEDGTWDDGLIVVTEVVHAARATILVSGGKDSTVELSGAVDAVGLAAAESGLEVVKSQNIATQILARGNLTPLFRSMGIRKRFLHRAELDRRGVEPFDSPQYSLELAEVDYEDFS
ncbi:hypothetical protein [Embleya sp. NBC_00896]|uniref:hypothetical protein n=1 Tax=Embleya sp. NBC_00896 TaxID=2975961 RepID=UPI00386E3FB7|nr:adenylyl cyclase-associated domain-containing protein [Embleya sp. NBC_00896]